MGEDQLRLIGLAASAAGFLTTALWRNRSLFGSRESSNAKHHVTVTVGRTSSLKSANEESQPSL